MESNKDPFATFDETVAKPLEQKMREFTARRNEEVINFYQDLHRCAAERKKTFPGGKPLTEEERIMLSIFNAETNNTLIDFHNKIEASRRQYKRTVNYAVRSGMESIEKIYDTTKIPAGFCINKLEEFCAAVDKTTDEFTFELKATIKKCHADYDQYLKENGFLNILPGNIKNKQGFINLFLFGKGVKTLFLTVLDGENETPTIIEIFVLADEDGKELDLQKGAICIATASVIEKLEKLLGKQQEELKGYLLEPILRLLNPGGNLNAEVLTLTPKLTIECVAIEVSPEVSDDEQAVRWNFAPPRDVHDMSTEQEEKDSNASLSPRRISHAHQEETENPPPNRIGRFIW